MTAFQGLNKITVNLTHLVKLSLSELQVVENELFLKRVFIFERGEGQKAGAEDLSGIWVDSS